MVQLDGLSNKRYRTASASGAVSNTKSEQAGLTN